MTSIDCGLRWTCCVVVYILRMETSFVWKPSTIPAVSWPHSSRSSTPTKPDRRVRVCNYRQVLVSTANDCSDDLRQNLPKSGTESTEGNLFDGCENISLRNFLNLSSKFEKPYLFTTTSDKISLRAQHQLTPSEMRLVEEEHRPRNQITRRETRLVYPFAGRTRRPPRGWNRSWGPGRSQKLVLLPVIELPTLPQNWFTWTSNGRAGARLELFGGLHTTPLHLGNWKTGTGRRWGLLFRWVSVATSLAISQGNKVVNQLVVWWIWRLERKERQRSLAYAGWSSSPGNWVMRDQPDLNWALLLSSKYRQFLVERFV